MSSSASTVEEGRAQIEKLVDAFERNYARYTDSSFIEAAARLTFIDPFWRALGWPVGSQPSVVPELRDVRIETNIRGSHPDYQFQPNGVVAFFCEAKKPAEDLKNNHSHIFQAKSYAWSFNRRERTAPFCVLTDFEEFRFFTVEKRPEINLPFVGLVPDFDIRYTDYVDRFDDLWATFSRDAVSGGSLLRFLGKRYDTRQALNVDFLDDLFAWRKNLARGVWRSNPGCTEDELNECVQRAIDRVLFIRMMEERGMEPKALLAQASKSPDPWKSLVSIRKQLRPRYNGQLFEPHFSDDLAVPARPLRAMLDGLDPEISPYRFNAMDVELLGRIYEAYLGRTIKVNGSQCTVEMRWDRRKDGGVYYTPQPIVKLICDRVLGPLLKGKTPTTAKSIRILDPACGSGSFLIGAYGYLLDWHTSWYNEHKKQVLGKRSKFHEDVDQDSNGDLRLSLAKRADILRSCIYGVDIDPGAVEVAILSLYLKLLEDAVSPTRQLMLVVRGAILPNLNRNVVCGNALVGHEVYDSLGADGWTKEFEQRVNPMEWEDVFPFKFDAVIGNPPYIKEYQNRQVFDDLKRSRYAHLYRGKMDIWYAFTGACMDILKPGGRHGFITQNNWPQSQSAVYLRQMLREKATVESLVDFHDRMVFEEAGIQTMVYVLRNESQASGYSVELARLDHDGGEPLDFILRTQAGFTKKTVWVDPAGGKAVMPFVETRKVAILNHLATAGDFRIAKNEVGQGIIGGPDKAFLHPSLAGMNREEKRLMHAHYTSAERFTKATSDQYIAYITRESVPTLEESRLPVISKQLRKFKEKLSGRRETRNGRIGWYHLHWPRSRRLFDRGPKLACPTRVSRPSFAVIEDEYFCSRAVNMLVTDRLDIYYLCGVLNSSAVHYWLLHRGKRLGSMLQIDTGFLLGIPIPSPETSRELSDQVAGYARDLHETSARLAEARSTRERERVARLLSRQEGLLNQAVYGLYKLSAKQIREIESDIRQ